MAYQKMKMMGHVGPAHTFFDLSTAIYIYSGNKEIVLKCEDEKMTCKHARKVYGGKVMCDHPEANACEVCEAETMTESDCSCGLWEEEVA